MQFGVGLFGLKPNLLPVLARHADELGYDMLWCSDHLMPLTEISANYPYSESKLPPFEPDWPWFDPWALLSSLASVTQRIRFGTNVYILPLRHPFVTARAVATLDIVSEGRALLGAGVGWWPEEFEAAGQDFKSRGPRSTEITEILRRLWTEDTVEYQGEHYSFPPVKFEPKPVQRPIPIEFGGSTMAALRRAAREGDGWIPTALSDEELKSMLQRLREARKEAGRDHLPFNISISVGGAPAIDTVKRYEEIGVTRLGVAPHGAAGPDTTGDQIRAGLETFANDVIAKL